MTRPLLLIAAIGFVTCVVCFAVVAALGPIQWRSFHISSDDWDRGPPVSGGGPEVTRDIPWTPGDRLTFSIPADVTYTQGPTARMTVTGPQGAVDQVELDGSSVRFGRRVHGAGRLKVAVTAPAVEEFTIAGSQTLQIEGYDRPRLEITIAGSGDVRARGRTGELELQIAGSGDADLGGLAAETAEVQIAGSGDASVAPTRSVEVQVAGSGDVTLLTRPDHVESRVLGSGRIIQPPPPTPAPAPATT